MREQIRWWLRPQDGDGILAIFARLDSHGARLIRESTGEFESWGTEVDTAGTYQATTPEDLVGSWTRRAMPRVAFNLWCGPDLGAMVSLSQDDRRCEFIIDLDGFWFDEAEKLAAILFWIAVTTEDSIALIAAAIFDFLPEWPLFVEDPSLIQKQEPDLFWIKSFGEGGTPYLHARPGYWWRP